MSASSLMGRTSFLILMMAAGLVAYAADAPATVVHSHLARRRHVTTRTHASDRAPAHVERRGETARTHSRVADTHSEALSRRQMERRAVLRTEAERRHELAAREIRTRQNRARELRVSEIRRVEERTVTDRTIAQGPSTAQPSAGQPSTEQPSTERAITERPVADRAAIERHDAVDVAASDRTETDSRPADATDSKPDLGEDSASAEGEVEDSVRMPSVAERPEPRSLHSIGRGGMPAPMRGSLALLERQDERLQADGLERIEDETDLAARIAHHMLVPLPTSAALTVNAQLPTDNRYCRPWTARFVADLARAHEAAFHKPLEVNSAVRTVAYQRRLERVNGNAAPAVGNVWSPHLMGATIDIGKKGMSWPEIAWMRRQLTALEDAGKIDVEEEFQQACFHITVYKSYALPHGVRPAPVQTETEEAGATTAGQ